MDDEACTLGGYVDSMPARSPPRATTSAAAVNRPAYAHCLSTKRLRLALLIGGCALAAACSRASGPSGGDAAAADVAPGLADVAPDSARGSGGMGAGGAGGLGSGGALGTGGTGVTGGTASGTTSSVGGSAAGGVGGTSSGGTRATAGRDGGADLGGAGTGGLPVGTGGAASGGQSGRGGSSGAGSGFDAGREAGGAGMGGAIDAGPAATGGMVGSYGNVYFISSTRTQIVRLQTTLMVPPSPPATGTLFLWPGLEPLTGSANFQPIGTGVLQPVLTWGSSCAPGTQPRAYSSWWISAQYVNTLGSAPGYMGCYGGPTMTVAVGDALDIDMQLTGTAWNQTVTDGRTGTAVSFKEDLGGQGQNWVLFSIEGYSASPVSGVTFLNTVITYAAADSAHCKLDTRGPTDFVSVPQASSDGLQCSIQEIILRAQGITN